VSKLEQIKEEVRQLFPVERGKFLDWLEDQFEVTEEFKKEIAQGKRDIAEGRFRVGRTAD